MKRLIYAAVMLLPLAASVAEPEFTTIENTAFGQEVTWTTQTNHNYQLDLSIDLLSAWIDSGIVEPGTGSNTTYGFDCNADDLCFRVRETVDSYAGSFVILPINDQTNRLGEGVGIAYDLNVFTNDFVDLPGSVDIQLREHGTDESWEPIGHITDFMERKNIRFVRGSVVWIPDETGVYDVRSIVKTQANVVCALEDRKVTIITNQPPSVVINSALATSYGSYLECTTTVTDSMDNIEYVDFYDDGILVGRDDSAPFGDDIRNREDDRPVLFNGLHSITAMACDSLGAKSWTLGAFILQTSGYSNLPRPKVMISNPTNEVTVMTGDMLTIDFSLINSTGTYVNSEFYTVDLNDGSEQVLSSAPFQSIDVNTSGWEQGMHLVKIYARENYPYGPMGEVYADSYPQYIDVYIETSNRLAFAEMLVSNIVDEVSVTFTNVRYTGVMPASATFTNGLAHGLQMDEGIIMTTGSARLWNAGKDKFDISEWDDDFMSYEDKDEHPGDKIISRLLGAVETYDAVILEFDAILNTNKQFECEYQLGSDEFLDYVSYANDTPLINVDGVHTSFLPNLSDTISINNFHPAGVNDFNTAYASTNEHLYVSVDELTASNGFHKVEYDGISIPLKSITLIKRDSFHFRYSITDVEDERWDSAIFTKKNSVRFLDIE